VCVILISVTKLAASRTAYEGEIGKMFVRLKFTINKPQYSSKKLHFLRGKETMLVCREILEYDTVSTI
jgi:hypothetical protein